MKVVLAQTLPPVTYETFLEKYVNRAFYFLLAASFFHFLESHVEAGIAVYIPGLGKILVDDGMVSDGSAAERLEESFLHCAGPLCEYDLWVMRIWAVLWLLYNLYMYMLFKKIGSNDVRMIRRLGLGKSGSKKKENNDNDVTDVQKLVEEAEKMSQAKDKPEAKDEEEESESDSEEAEE